MNISRYNMILIAGVIISGLLLLLVIAIPNNGNTYYNFYIKDQNGNLGGFQQEYQQNSTIKFSFVVENYLSNKASFKIILSSNSTSFTSLELHKQDLSLGDSWVTPVNISLASFQPGAYKMTAKLYQNDTYLSDLYFQFSVI